MNATTKHASGPMIFVTGASRSGTTLMSHVLGRHSEVAGLREMHYFGDSWSPRGSNRTMSATEASLAVATLFRRQIDVRTCDEEADIRRVLDSLSGAPDSADVFAAAVAHFARRIGKRIPCEQTP